MAKETKEVAVKESHAISAEVMDLSQWGTPVNLGQDLVLSKILLMQGMSQLVMDGKAMFGEYRDSLSGAKLGSIVEPLVLVPFHAEKYWDIYEMNADDDKFKWVRTEPLIEDPTRKDYNDNLPWLDKVNGVETKRVRRLLFYFINPKEVATGEAVPVVMAFKSTSYKEGKKLLSQMYMRNRKAGLPPCGYTIILSGKKEKNDDGTWAVPTYELGPKAEVADMQECLNWYKLIARGGVKVDNSDMEEVDTNSMPVGGDSGTGDY